MDASTTTVEAVVLARTFERPRSFLVESDFPDSVLRLYDRVTADPGWATAPDLAERAYLVFLALEQDGELRAAYEADRDAGLLGFGAGEDEELETALDALSRRVRPEEAMVEPEPPRPAAEPPAAAPSRGGAQKNSGLAGRREPPAAEPSDGSGTGDGLLGGGPLPEVDPLAPPRASRPTRGAPRPTRGAPRPNGPTRGAPRPNGPRADGPPAPAPSAPAPSQPPSQPAPLPDGASPEAVQSYLNAKLEDTDTSQPLQVGTDYSLAVWFAREARPDAASARVGLVFPPDTDHLDLTIRVLSAEFETPPLPQQIRVRRDGTSQGRLLFPIIPKVEGPATLTVMVDFQGNFVQQVVLRYDVAGAPAADVTVTNLGRPASAAAVLGPREASMRFTPAIGGYKLFVPGVTQDEVLVRLTADELAARIEKVRSELLTLVKNETFALSMDIPPELRDIALGKLARAGFRLYQRIFEGPLATAELRAVGAWLRDALSDEVTTLQVVSTGFPVPWALVYLTDRWDATKLDWHNFIGMRHIVEQVPMREIPITPPSPMIDSAPALGIHVLYNDGIDAQMPSHPVAAQRAYWGSRHGLQLIEGTSVAELFDSALATSATDKVLYLYCHAVASNTDPDDSHLVLSGDEKVTLGELSVRAPTGDLLPSAPLVFVNACESGDLSPNFYDGFVPYFLAKGARGVIGTECKTPGLFASEWAQAFFDRFFTGEQLGTTILTLRRQFLAEHGNPLGLLYGVYCDPDTRVDPAVVAA
jgi:CHAT domain